MKQVLSLLLSAATPNDDTWQAATIRSGERLHRRLKMDLFDPVETAIRWALLFSATGSIRQ